MTQKKKNQLISIIFLFLIWRIGLFVLACIAPYFLTYKPSFPYADMLAQSQLPAWIYSWANFDGVHYLTIAKQGYQGVGLIQAFFPVFPFLLRLGHQLTGWHYILVGLVISSVATLASLFFINATLKIWGFQWRLRLLTLIVFLGLSGSLFQGAVYTEGIFIMLVWFNLYLVAKKQYFLASLVTMIASATRLTGVFLVIPIVLSYLSDKLEISSWQDLKIQNIKLKVKKAGFKPFWQSFLFVLVGSLGLLVYMAYLTQNYHDPLYFLHVQNEFGLGKEEKIVLYPQVVWRGLKILLTVKVYDLKYFTYLQEFFWGTVGLGLILISLKLKKVPKYVLMLSLFLFFLPTTIGTFSSMSRYILPAASLPLSFLVIYQKNRWLFLLALIGIIGLLAVNTVMFIQGYWVA